MDRHRNWEIYNTMLKNKRKYKEKFVNYHYKFKQLHTQTQPFNRLWSGTTRVGRYQKQHSPTHTHPDHRTSFIIFLHFTTINGILFCSFYVLDSPLVQPLSRSSLVFLLVLDPQLHTPYISSPNHHLLFAAHAHTNAACSAAIPMLCHIYLVSLNSLLGSLSFRMPQF